MSNKRHFIFFYRVVTSTHHWYGVYGRHDCSKIPSNNFVSCQIAIDNKVDVGKVNITSFNEVSLEDYNSWFERDDK